MSASIGNDIPQGKSNDELLEDAHNDYINQVTESGLPLWVADMYSHSIYSSINLPVSEEEKNNLPAEDKHKPDLPF